MSYTETSLDVIRLSRVDKNPPVKRLKLISVGSKDAAVWALTGSSCLSLGVVVCLWASAALFPVTLENISDPLSSATFLPRVLWARAALAVHGWWTISEFFIGENYPQIIIFYCFIADCFPLWEAEGAGVPAITRPVPDI